MPFLMPFYLSTIKSRNSPDSTRVWIATVVTTTCSSIVFQADPVDVERLPLLMPEGLASLRLH